MMFRYTFPATMLYFLILSGCSLGVYKVPIQQGNLIAPGMLEKLQPGMNADQVEFILGKPLIPELVGSSQWLYFYEKEVGKNNIQGYRIRVFFTEEGLYSHYEGSPDKQALPKRFN